MSPEDGEDCSLAIFDLVRRRFTAGPIKGLERGIWSPDSRWVVAEGDGNVTLVGRNGGTRRIHLGEHSGDLYWRHDKLARLLYCDNRGSVVECNVITDRRHMMWRGGVFLSLFSVRGILHVSYFRGRSFSKADRRTVHVVRLDTKREILSIPLSDTADWDVSRLELSPDGRYLFLTGWWSGSARNVVARIEDAHDVFKEPHKAIMFWDTDCTFDITWPTQPARRDGTGVRTRYALIHPSLPWWLFLDLRTGSMRDMQVPSLDDFKLAALRRPIGAGHLFSVSDWYFVTNAGLVTYAAIDSKPDILIRHKPRHDSSGVDFQGNQ